MFVSSLSLAVDLEAWEETCYAEKQIRFIFPPPLLDLDRTRISLLQNLIPSHNAETFRTPLPDWVVDKSMSIPQPTGLHNSALYSHCHFSLRLPYDGEIWREWLKFSEGPGLLLHQRRGNASWGGARDKLTQELTMVSYHGFLGSPCRRFSFIDTFLPFCLLLI